MNNLLEILWYINANVTANIKQIGPKNIIEIKVVVPHKAIV